MNCIIAATESRLFQGLDIPANIRIKGVTHEQFRELMAKAYLVVVPTEKGLLRSVGQQTFLNAMAMGKVCVVTDPQGACDYIEHGKDGFLTEPGDFESLRLILDILIKDPKLAAAIGKNAAEKARLYSTEDSMKGIINVAREIVQSNTRKNTVK
jgi:glycosyltransferase involved in cell wall biosynthesis